MKVWSGTYIYKKLGKMAGKEWYRNWFSSPYYHKLYFQANEKESKIFIKNLVEYLQPKADSLMLEVSCAMGRRSKILSDYGFDVTGFDLSHDNIQYAKQFEEEHLHFYQHDMRLPFWINYFDYAFNFFNSFGFFNTRREHDSAVRAIAASLKPGGTLIFDYPNVHYAEENLVPNEIKIISETKYEINRWMDKEHFYNKILVTDPELKEPLEWTEKIKKFSFGDFTDMLSFQKMQVTEVFGDHDLNPYHIKQKPRMIITAMKQV